MQRDDPPRRSSWSVCLFRSNNSSFSSAPTPRKKWYIYIYVYVYIYIYIYNFRRVRGRRGRWGHSWQSHVFFIPTYIYSCWSTRVNVCVSVHLFASFVAGWFDWDALIWFNVVACFVVTAAFEVSNLLLCVYHCSSETTRESKSCVNFYRKRDFNTQQIYNCWLVAKTQPSYCLMKRIEIYMYNKI